MSNRSNINTVVKQPAISDFDELSNVNTPTSLIPPSKSIRFTLFVRSFGKLEICWSIVGKELGISSKDGSPFTYPVPNLFAYFLSSSSRL